MIRANSSGIKVEADFAAVKLQVHNKKLLNSKQKTETW